MDQFRRYCYIWLAAGIVLAGCSGNHADRSQELSLVDRGEVHEGWYFAAGQTVLIEGTVNGDVYAAGGEIEITGTVNGDVLVAGGTVDIIGTVTEDVRAGGGTVRISGTVDGNCTVAGGSFVISSEGVVRDNVLAVGGTIRISGRAEKEVKVFCEELVISGSVGQDLQFGGDRIEILEGATVGGDATIDLRDKEDAIIADGTVLGETHIRLGEELPEAGMFAKDGGSFLFAFLYALSMILIALLAVFVLPKKMTDAKKLLKDGFGMTILWGILGLILVPIAVVLLMIVVVGIPLGLFVLVLYLWFLYLSQLSLPVLASWWITKDESARGWKLFWPIALGVIVLQLLMLVPYLGSLLWLAGAILGLGVILRLVASSLALASKA